MIYQVGSGGARFCVTPNQAIPSEGPKTIPLVLDFSSANNEDILVDLQQFEQLGRMSMVQTIYIDMSNAANNLIVIMNDSGQQIVAKVGTQGYYNVLAPNPARFTFRSVQGSTDALPVYLINVPIPGQVWPTI